MVVIGVSGPSGSGKSSLSRRLCQHLPNSRLIHQDWYFKSADELSTEDNYCDLDCLHLSRFISDIRSLLNGQSVLIQKVDLSTFLPTNETELIEIGDYLIIEGMTIFRVPEIFSVFDQRIYLDPGLDQISQRKTKRDLLERGKTLENVLNQLSWVQHEYKWDLENIAQKCFVISGTYSEDELCRLALKYIRAGGGL